MGNRDSTFYTYQAIVERKPDDFISLIYLSNAYGDGGYYTQMKKLLYQLKRYHPKKHWWATNMSYYLNEAGQFELSRNYADTSLTLATDSTTIGIAFNNRSYANLGLGDIKSAIDDNTKALLYFPNNSFAYKNLALIYLKKADTTNACNALNKAKNLGGHNITQNLIERFCE